MAFPQHNPLKKKKIIRRNLRQFSKSVSLNSIMKIQFFYPYLAIPIPFHPFCHNFQTSSKNNCGKNHCCFIFWAHGFLDMRIKMSSRYSLIILQCIFRRMIKESVYNLENIFRTLKFILFSQMLSVRVNRSEARSRGSFLSYVTGRKVNNICPQGNLLKSDFRLLLCYDESEAHSSRSTAYINRHHHCQQLFTSMGFGDSRVCPCRLR